MGGHFAPLVIACSNRASALENAKSIKRLDLTFLCLKIMDKLARYTGITKVLKSSQLENSNISLAN